MIAPDLLKILVCPETHQPLAPADAAVIESLNRRIPAGQVTNRAGHKVTEPVEGGLIREDGKLLYPIRNNLPIMLIDEGIPLSP
jgi:uncharacterized protein YbaR (Trm112 family)